MWHEIKHVEEDLGILVIVNFMYVIRCGYLNVIAFQLNWQKVYYSKPDSCPTPTQSDHTEVHLCHSGCHDVNGTFFQERNGIGGRCKRAENEGLQKGVVAVYRWLKGVTQRNITRPLDEWKCQRGKFYPAMRKSNLGVETAMLEVSWSLERVEAVIEHLRNISEEIPILD